MTAKKIHSNTGPYGLQLDKREILEMNWTFTDLVRSWRLP